MRIIKYLTTIILSTYLFSCASLQPALQPATSIKNDAIQNYKYLYISPTNSLTSSSGATINGLYYSSSKSVNPADVISGILSKEGFIKIPEQKPELTDQTIIVNYGESGKRKTGLGGYTIEVTIQFISAKSNNLVCSCTAEGQGETEADDIRQAITRCLNEIVTKRN